MDPGNGEPLGLQIERQLRLAVASGRIAPGERLPSARELAARLAVNFHTVRAAYGELEKEGLVVCRHGRGTFVSTDARPLNAADLRRVVRGHVERLAEDLAAAHVDPGALAALVADELRRTLGTAKVSR